MKNGLFILFVIVQVLVAQDNLEKVQFLVQQGNQPWAIEMLENLIEQEPDNPANYFELGKIYNFFTMSNEAIGCFKKVIELDTTNVVALMELGRAYKNSDNVNEAIITLTQVLKIQPNNISVKKMLGELFFDKQQYINARKIYWELFEIEMLHNVATVNIGLCELKLGNIDDAIKQFELAYQENPTNLQTVILLSNAYTLGTDFIKAEKLLEYEYKKYPLNQKLLDEYSRILFHNKKFEPALEIFSKMQEDSQKDWERYQKMGMCYYYLDRAKYAEMFLNNSMRKDSTNYLTNYYLGLTKMELEKWAEAEKYLYKAIQMSTPSFLPEAMMRRAISLENMQEYNASMKSYQLAVNFAPQRKDMHYYIATLVDKYFSDENLALEKYQYFLDNCEGCDVRMKNYAEARIDEIKENIIFRGK